MPHLPGGRPRGGAPQARGIGRRPQGRRLDTGDARTELAAPVQKLSAEYFPGVAVLPILQPGATDGQFLNAAGIPTYGIEPLFMGPDIGHIHGLNEYVSVKSLLDCRDFLYRLIKIYAEEK